MFSATLHPTNRVGIDATARMSVLTEIAINDARMVDDVIKMLSDRSKILLENKSRTTIQPSISKYDTSIHC
jgi:hypothetical protein